MPAAPEPMEGHGIAGRDEVGRAETLAGDAVALEDLLAELCQRERNEKWGPRTIDLDLIQYGSLLSYADELLLPHPRAHERRFVLEPWFDIEPDAILLTHGKISDLLSQLP